MEDIAQFFDSPFFSIVRGISTSLIVFGAVALVYGTVRGFLPVLWRLGKSLNNRKIALYAETSALSLKTMLTDSKLFKEKNIHIVSNDEISKGGDYTMMIVNYPEFKDSMKQIIGQKKDEDSLIVYAPQDSGRIDDEILNAINKQRNSIIVNMRGRLLNDVLTAMITTNYAKK
ncbi:MAG TPA: hypothetical protein VFM99_03235 [Chitinophagales bacterium]|nr:hypothetical protein [Chitinophagales bacterium]